MTLESRMHALLDIVEADRKNRCDAITGDARAHAATTIAAAHAEARGHIRDTFREERRRSEARVSEARARLVTHQRLHEQRRAGNLLAAGWRKLAPTLCDRWRQPELRQPWIGTVIAQARQVLPRGAWRIAYAPGWPDDERRALATALTSDLGWPPEFIEDDAAHAGLKVSTGGNVIDGTLAGLTADRAEIGSRLLVALEGDV